MRKYLNQISVVIGAVQGNECEVATTSLTMYEVS